MTLMIARDKDERVVIEFQDGTTVIVTMCGWDGRKARLAVEAPKEVAVHRMELWLELKAQGKRFIKSHEDSHNGRQTPD